MTNLNKTLKTLVRGDTYSVAVSIKDASGSPVDVSGRSIYMTLKRHLTDTDEQGVQTSGVLSGADAVNGIARLMFTPQQTDALENTQYWYDIQLVSPASIIGGSVDRVHTLQRGRLPVELDVTRTTNVSESVGVVVIESYEFGEFTIVE